MVTPILDHLPFEYDDAGLLSIIQSAIRDYGRKLVVLDDDPTGVQTVHDIAVLTRWSTEAIDRELQSPNSVFFILTNSRSQSSRDAVALNRSITNAVREASRITGTDVVLLSRSDSTLRGHFPEETDVLAAAVDSVDGVILCPAFIEGGRVTINGTHYVRDVDHLTPVAKTEFARDQAFGYRSSFLPDWVQEKSHGRIPSTGVMVISLADLREGGPDHITSLLQGVVGGQVVVIDALGYRDLEVAALGIIRAELLGKRFIYRCSASLVRVRAGLPERALLLPSELLGTTALDRGHIIGLVIVGSHVQRTTDQLERVLALATTLGVEVSVTDLLASDASRARTVAGAAATVDDAMRHGLTPVVYTSRAIISGPNELQLETGQRVSKALVDIVHHISERPSYVIAKGGITSSDIGTEGLGVERAVVVGQVSAGIPVWRLGPETRFPGLPYVVFPGNVGDDDTLADLVANLTNGDDPEE